MTKIRKAATSKPCVHYVEDYIINPQHPVTVNVIGCGGTGSQVLNSLARMNSALKALGHPGLFVRAIDPDRITEANMGRQLFSPADVGDFKCNVLAGRINRFFGTDWTAHPVPYHPQTDIKSANITISCVDSGAARKEIKATLKIKSKAPEPMPTRYGYQHEDRWQPYEVPYYWLDFGNMKDRGQAVIGTLRGIEQPTDSEFTTVDKLPTVDKVFPDILIDARNEDQGPSCSLAEALDKQDLFINTNVANTGLALLWKMFRDLRLQYHGVFVNLSNLSTNPIKVKVLQTKKPPIK